ncbi:AFR637Wp [Eremothecium gossypii ATCC 10895]|uniref:DNA repair protein RAD50 n=1 Tax=Eremothecium gossypii (strain ATCC 10895 / CBS 109.51 / FGSC 9923 / NRRL Y-1056) TaxID=284811 RepID=Q752D9_EREGS|nr:AFR637Wp [Eremothecium gossypii ATCC 10895]AAS54008.2 AFR637Wp [Eremothecium gossypii ATCC 10895]AEY98322.1 FAFR637Wp [Eremothecium gossypii FDAG1]
MSAIHNLSIQGIRSFDARDKEVIKFGKPLTLIVGANGCGKTTIIECLKYATTGDLPPNSKNGAFIHDPKINGEVDVRAQVKLAFTNANGVQMIVTRNIQLMKKRTTTTFKTLEGQLVAINRGERTTLSTRAADLDQQVPIYLGVPKAILEYVIFCHQEDSLWPLSEPANLKKRFDEIFQAMKFTKALDNLKGIKKDMAIDIKLLKQSVEHLKIDRDRSRAIKRSISELEHKVKDYQSTVPEIERQLKEITEQSDKLFYSNQQFQQVLSKIDSLGHSRDSIGNQIQRLQDSIEPLDMDREKLVDLLENFSSSLAEKEEAINRMEIEAAAADDELQSNKATYESLLSESAVLKSKQKEYEKNRDLLTELTNQLASEGINTEDSLGCIESMIQKAETKISDLRLKHQKELNEAQERLSGKQNELIREEQKLSYTKDDRAKLNDQLMTLKQKLARISETESELEISKQDLEKYKPRVEMWQKENAVDRFNEEIKSKNDEMLLLENDVEKVQIQISNANQHSELLAKYSLLKTSVVSKKQQLEEAISKFKADEHSKFLGIEIDDDFELEFKKKYISIQKQLAQASRNASEIKETYSEKEFTAKNIESDLVGVKTAISECKEKLQMAMPEDCTIEEYEELVQESEESYKVALENLKMHRTTLEFNQKALEIAETTNCCYLCRRNFDKDSERSKLIEELKSRTNTAFEKTLEDTLNDEKQYLASLRALEKDIVNLRSLKMRAVTQEKHLQEAKLQLGKNKAQHEDAQRQYSKLRETQEHFEQRLRPLFHDIIRLQKELAQVEGEYGRLSDEVKIYGGSSEGVYTVEELQRKQTNINERLRVLRKEVGRLQEEKERKATEFNNLVALVREKTFKVTEMEKQLQEKQQIQKDAVGIELSIGNMDGILLDAETVLERLAAEVSTLKTTLASIRNEQSEKDSQEARQLNGLKTKYMQLKGVIDSMKEFDDVHSKRLVDVTALLTRSQQDSEELTKRINTLGKRIAKENQKLKDSTNEQKNMKLNLDLIDLKSQMKEISEELVRLDARSAEAQRDKYQQESMKLRTEFEKLSSENAGKLGEIKQLQNQIALLTNQLQSEYRDVDDRYQQEWAKLQTKTLVTDDIDTYSKVLDSAIMKYHGLKMEDINRIIDELWKRTYSGTDVDSIKIKSDEVNSTTRGKSYNYRVVMYKQDAELDMRGRCSAGQKVLASIIIRLALSETFGTNCGVIALDEPTTNLDEENISSLARSLSNIIKFRRHQKNFQLIVITHDEKFLDHMNAVNFTDHFWKVKRDERQTSQIEMVDIAVVS